MTLSSLVIAINTATLQLLFSAICLQFRVHCWMSELINYFGGPVILQILHSGRGSPSEFPIS